MLSTVPFGLAGFHIATDVHLCYNENQPCHTSTMAVLRADRGTTLSARPTLRLGKRARASDMQNVPI